MRWLMTVAITRFRQTKMIAALAACTFLDTFTFVRTIRRGCPPAPHILGTLWALCSVLPHGLLDRQDKIARLLLRMFRNLWGALDIVRSSKEIVENLDERKVENYEAIRREIRREDNILLDMVNTRAEKDPRQKNEDKDEEGDKEGDEDENENEEEEETGEDEKDEEDEDEGEVEDESGVEEEEEEDENEDDDK